MASYADHPDARRLYKLALKRRPANWKLPKPPAGIPSMALVMMAQNFPIGCIIRAKNSIGRSGGKCGAMSVASDLYLRKGWTLAFKRLVNNHRVKMLFHSVQMDKERANLAAGFSQRGATTGH